MIKSFYFIFSLFILLTMPSLLFSARGLMGMWVNTFDGDGNCKEGDSSYNSSYFDDFYHNIRDRLDYYSAYPQITQYSEGNVHGDKLLESWREYGWPYPTPYWNDGIDRNDADDRTVLIISTHGDVERSSYGEYFFRTLHQSDDYVVDHSYCLDSKHQRCRIWWRNYNYNGSRTLVRMGSSDSVSSIGDGWCRWIIFHTCRSLQMNWDDDDDFTVQDIWGHDGMNGGYRVILGGSGDMAQNTGSAGTTFVTRQYASGYTFKQAWFDTMDGYFLNGSGQNNGLCAIYAKGGSVIQAQDKRDNDDFLSGNQGMNIPSATDYPEGWHSAWPSMNCEE